jgi:uncharacterized protein YcbX
MSEITLSQLTIYPVKSCAGIQLQSADTSPFGLQYDRRWMLVDANGVMLTQRQHPRMCLIQPALDNGQLSLSAPAMNVLQVDQTTDRLSATVWEDQCSALDCGESAAEWLSEFMGLPSRLVYFPGDEIRQVDLSYAQPGDITAFSDGFPYLLISQASLDALNSRLQAPVEMRRFRPNLVVEGCEAFAEDQWQSLLIGGVTFRRVKPCSRCVIPSIDPHTAEKNPEVIRTLAGFRKSGKRVLFGQNLTASGNGTLHTGMAVRLIDTP